MNKIGNWPTRALYGFVALAMVLSLVLLGGAAPMAGTTEPVAAEGSETGPSQPVAAYRSEAGPDIPELVVYIERPADDDAFNVSDTFYVNAVVAYKDINENGDSSELVTATIDPGPYAELVAGETAIKTATINRNCVGDFWWKLHCKGQGDATITVNATASGLPVGQDSVTVTQGEPTPACDLEITIIQPTGDDRYVEVCNDFVVKARVSNNSSSTTATNVTAGIVIDPDTGAEVTGGEPHYWNVGDILAGKHVHVLWNLHCTDDGAVNITVDATAGGVTKICPDSVIVHQGEEPPDVPTGCLDVTLIAPTEVCTVGCNYSDFQVTANITNTCGHNCTNITATISKTAGGAYASIEPPLVQNAGTLEATNSTTVTWNVTCINIGNVTFQVVAEGVETPECVGQDTATVEQKKILIDLVEPETGETIRHNICQTFNVTANITNCDCFPLENVTVELALPDSVCITANTTIHITQYDQDGYADDWDIDPEDLDDPEKIPFTSFCACCIYTVEWIDLHCCDPSPDYGQTAEEVYIRVWDGDTLKEEDYFRVKQTEKAHLAAGVEVYLGTSASNVTGPTACNMSTTSATAVAVNQSFVVVVPVINMGMAAAQNVTVNVTITGNATCAGNISRYLGTIPGRSAKKTFISCNCSADGAVNITISGLSGNDAVKRINHPSDPDLYAIPEDNIFDCGGKILKQIPIIIEIVQPEVGQNFTCCDDFVVKVKVTNNSTIPGNDLDGVTATIDWTGPAEFNLGAPSGYETKDLGDLPAGNHTYVGWNLHCDDTGDVVFTITIESTNPVWSDTVTVTVHQIPNATLAVDILSPDNGSVYRTSEEFAVTANVTVTQADLGFVENVMVYIYDDCDALDFDYYLIPLGTMAENQTKIVSWTVHAVEAGMQCAFVPCEITVLAYAPCAEEGYHDKTVNIYPAANLLVEITDDAPEEVVVCDTFNITARVTNIGWADATGVKLLLSVIPEDSVRPVPGETYEEPIGTLVGYGQSDVEDVGYKEVTWTLHCKTACESTITITPVGYDECGWHPVLVNPAEAPRENGPRGQAPYYVMVSLPGREIEDRFLHADSVTVKQVEPAQLVVDISYPADGAEFKEGDSFVVSGTVSNIGEETATGVTATLTVDANASITDAAKSLGTIAGGQSKNVTWNVQCTAEGFSTFKATATGTGAISSNAVEAFDTVTVKQGQPYIAQLAVDITYPANGAEITVGDQFMVTATIENLGDKDAQNVALTATISGNAVVDASPTGWPKNIGRLSSATASWTLNCTGAGFSVIEIQASGTNTNSAVDSVTVNQIAPPEPYLTVEVGAPAQILVDQSYYVTAVVSNTGDADAAGVSATLAISGDATATEALNQSIGGIAAGSADSVTWTLSADAAGGVNLDVSAQGTGTNVAVDTASVTQLNPFEAVWSGLSVAPTSGDAPLTVNVLAMVSNSGDVAGGCLAELKVDGEVVDDQVVVVAGGATETIGFTYEFTAGTYQVTINDLTPVTVIVGWDPWFYDSNEDDVIDKSEALQAIMDYFDGIITKAQVLEVLALYFG